MGKIQFSVFGFFVLSIDQKIFEKHSEIALNRSEGGVWRGGNNRKSAKILTFSEQDNACDSALSTKISSRNVCKACSFGRNMKKLFNPILFQNVLHSEMPWLVEMSTTSRFVWIISRQRDVIWVVCVRRKGHLEKRTRFHCSGHSISNFRRRRARRGCGRCSEWASGLPQPV